VVTRAPVPVTDPRAIALPVGTDTYAVPMSWAREVLATPATTPLVTAPPFVVGLINLRGEIVPLLDTAALLGVGRVAEPPYAVVLETPTGPVGLAATGLPVRVVLDAPVGPSSLPGTAGAYRIERRVVVLLDPTALLGSHQVAGDDGTAATFSGTA
jgi:purine-binding chemotaxis protein CheW